MFVTMTSCKKTNSPAKASNCTERILKIDDSLGSVRNHACENKSLSKTIGDYATVLSNLDFTNCPANFKNAFKKHEIAWQDMIHVTKNYPDLRGELHDLFDQIEAGPDSLEFKNRLKLIWDTWAKIEEAAK